MLDLSLNLGLAAKGGASFLSASASLTIASTSTIAIASATRVPSGGAELTSLTLDGADILSRVTTPDSPNMAVTTNPGTKSGSNDTISALTEALEIGALYMLTYEVTQNSGLKDLYMSTSQGCPAGADIDGNEPPATVGVHNVFFRPTSANTTTIMRAYNLSGGSGSTITIENLSVHKVEWDFALDAGRTGSDVFDNTGTAIGNGPIPNDGREIGSLTGVTEDDYYMLEYEVDANDAVGTTGNTGFIWTTSTSPFYSNQLLSPVGMNRHILRATRPSPTLTNCIRANTDGSFSVKSFRVFRVGDDRGKTLAGNVALGDVNAPLSVEIPEPGVWYVSPTGSDTNSGSINQPFRNVQPAIEAAQPGDTVYVRPGTYYENIRWDLAGGGEPGFPITVTTLPGEERQAILTNEYANDHMVFTDGVGHWRVRNLTFREVGLYGVMIRNDAEAGTGGVMRDIEVTDCHFEDIDFGAVQVYGKRFSLWGLGNTNIYTDDVLIARNTGTNVFQVGEDLRRIDGVLTPVSLTPTNEIFTAAFGVSNVIIEDNVVTDSRQYGVDIKDGVDGAIVRGNTFTNIERHGLYVDTAEGFVRNVDIYNNTVSGCGNGITLAREANNRGATYPPELRNVRVWNNTVWDCRANGFQIYEHHDDGPYGVVANVQIVHNTVVNCQQDANDDHFQEWNFTGWDDAAALAANSGDGVLQNFIARGNLTFRDNGTYSRRSVRNEWGSMAEATFEDNFNFDVPNGTDHTDPLFVDLPNDDFRLLSGSPAIDYVTGSNAAPYDKDANGDARGDPANAGPSDAVVAGVDSSPDPFNFASVLDAERSAVTTSAIVAITGTDTDAAISITGGRYRVYDASDSLEHDWSTGAGTLSPGEKVQIEVTASASYETAATATLTIGGVDGTFTVTTEADPAVAPTVDASNGLTGRTLSINVNSVSGTPTPTVSLTTLTLDGVDVLGDATGSDPWSYVVPDSASVQTVAWVVTATNSAGSDTASGSTDAPANLFAPANTAAPAITGTFETGQTLSVSQGTWTGTPTPTYAYQWTRGGADISGATSSTYTLVQADEGNVIDCDVTATNSVNSVTVSATGQDTPSAPVDTTPDAFDFTDETGAALSTVSTSDAVAISGINAAAAVTVSGGEYQILSAGDVVQHAWTTSAGTIENGEKVQLRATSSASNSTAVTVTVTVGGVSADWSVTTEAAAGGVTPASIYANGEKGGWFEPVSGQVFTDTGGTTAAALDDGIANITARAGTITVATQTDVNKRPLFKNPGAYFDGGDDAIEITVPTGGMSGQFYYASNLGKGPFGFSYPAGTRAIGNAGGADWDKTLYAMIFVDRNFTAGELTELDSEFSSAGDFNAQTDMGYLFRDSGLTQLPPNMTLSALENGSYTFAGCSLTSLPSGMTLPKLKNGRAMFLGCDFTSVPAGMTLPDLTFATDMFSGCTNLTTLPADFASQSNNIKWFRAFSNTNLTQQSIDNILTNLAARGTSGGVFNQSGGSAPSSTGETAIDTLRGRGWTITVTGGY